MLARATAAVYQLQFATILFAIVFMVLSKNWEDL